MYQFNVHELNNQLLPIIISGMSKLIPDINTISICFENDDSYRISLLHTNKYCPQELLNELREVISENLRNLHYIYHTIRKHYEDNSVTIEIIGLYHYGERESEDYTGKPDKEILFSETERSLSGIRK